jgi:hypothetical protein
VNTFEILLRCLPCFVSVGIGLYYLLATIFPSWREPGWNDWKIYSNGYSTKPTDTDPRSWPNYWFHSLLVQLGFEKAPKVIKEGACSPRKAMLIGVALILLGTAGIISIAYSNMNN